MPVYEYKCSKCGQVFEVRQRFSDAPVTQHEGCGGAVEKLLSAPALQFKGTGWYITDYARSGSRGGGDGSKGSESKPDTKSETKPETKSDSKSGTGSGTGTNSSSSSDSK